jgi:hypothetical protein
MRVSTAAAVPVLTCVRQSVSQAKNGHVRMFPSAQVRRVFSLGVHYITHSQLGHAPMHTAAFTCPTPFCLFCTHKRIAKRSMLAERLFAFPAVDGISFSGFFMSIFELLKKRGLMLGLTISNELLGHDEGMHTDFVCLLFSHMKRRPSTSRT